MAGLGYFLGGALQGLGSGLSMQGQSDAAARRDMALETLRAQNRKTEMSYDADLRDRNDARSTARDTTRQITVGKANTANQIKVDNARTDNDIKLKNIDFRNQKDMARLNSALDTQRDAASQNLRKQLENGEVVNTFEADDGQIWGITRTGQRVETGVYFAPKSQTDGDDILGARGGATEAPKPAARTKPVQAQSSGGGQAPAKTYTAREVSEAAKSLGWSEDEVRKWARSNGYKLTK